MKTDLSQEKVDRIINITKEILVKESSSFMEFYINVHGLVRTLIDQLHLSKNRFLEITKELKDDKDIKLEIEDIYTFLNAIEYLENHSIQ
jgi:hypothetical protein